MKFVCCDNFTYKLLRFYRNLTLWHICEKILNENSNIIYTILFWHIICIHINVYFNQRHVFADCATGDCQRANTN